MERIVYEDSRQQVHSGDKHSIKHKWFEAHGIRLVRVALTKATHTADELIAPAGDYCSRGSNVCVDTKANVDEVAGNINGRQHKRFIAECKRASEHGFRLVVLVENDLGYENLGDVVRWENTHCVKCSRRAKAGRGGGCNPRASGKCERHGTVKPIQGERLYKAMSTIQERYGARFMFCAPEDSARTICDLLGVKYD